MRTGPGLRVSCLLLLGLVSAASPALADNAWSLRLPKDEAVAFRGVVNFDGAGSGVGSMMYPAVGVAGLLVAVITHGVIVESQKNSQKLALQETADKVLAPYRPLLETFKHPALMESALGKVRWGDAGRLTPAADPATGPWVVDSLPVYAMTQDERALVLDNAVSIKRPDGSTYQAVVRVVSQPRPGEDVRAAWSEQDGAPIKAESAYLLAHSLELALAEADGSSSPSAAVVFKTVRYPEGSAERMERAQLVVQRCDRQVIRNLRGALISVPARAGGEPDASCEPALQGWK